jgi:hypothetical protein
MKRLGAVVLFAGAVLLSTHMLAPAEPPPSSTSTLAADLRAAMQAKPLIAQLDAQSTRLRARLANPPPFPAPRRDPFRFGALTTSRAPSRPAIVAAPAPPPAPPVQALPQLIAITTNAANGETARSAVLGLAAEVQVVKLGEKFLDFVVDEIDAESVTLRNPATDQTFKISLQ